MKDDPSKWYAQPTMQLVVGVLLCTLLSGIVIIAAALSGDDTLVISEVEYQQLRDDFRLTEARDRNED